ncbi:hypothetical protein J4G33_04405 [Actinotalea sp. BY-33]|uniref:Secreted protein n=1 Tax=Actinotalea soli TaxID=2819234 RepID=A0A939LRY7_9CELL|nr:hypothetical protein [Actinotalea soli]MBO1751039.1 hypothetical protein [Actinotalea soli]
MKRRALKRAAATVLVSAGLITATAGASSAAWYGACDGADWVIWDGNGNSMIWHGKCS